MSFFLHLGLDQQQFKVNNLITLNSAFFRYLGIHDQEIQSKSFNKIK